ncbi:hypothetical protein [Candidatus Sororendozoicomonas aggregata]|uniref:hypothetical protein n=1 Tax=Candidatus Sororendozoicomonas aggregata TaxID=3073239 RepID=UPI002ECFB091
MKKNNKYLFNFYNSGAYNQLQPFLTSAIFQKRGFPYIGTPLILKLILQTDQLWWMLYQKRKSIRAWHQQGARPQSNDIKQKWATPPLSVVMNSVVTLKKLSSFLSAIVHYLRKKLTDQ